jgi:hypothetical protein
MVGSGGVPHGGGVVYATEGGGVWRGGGVSIKIDSPALDVGTRIVPIFRLKRLVVWLPFSLNLESFFRYPPASSLMMLFLTVLSHNPVNLQIVVTEGQACPSFPE